jgi:glycosyltransferase involved in cell wall biosynthesis
MKIALVNTTDLAGGAAVACNRLALALQSAGHDVTLLARDVHGSASHVVSTTRGLKKYGDKYRFLSERLRFIAFHEASKEVRFAFSMADTGEDISKHPVIQAADIIHLHWINNGFLSLESIDKLIALGKPIVWTLHDMWAFTGGCHYSGTCQRYLQSCGDCPFLNRPGPKDLSSKIWDRKKALYKNGGITFVTCSTWLRDEARKSSLLNTFRTESIPNPIDTSFWSPGDRAAARAHFNLPADKKLLLFGAMNVQDKRKGFQYLQEALAGTKDIADLELVVFGKSKEALALEGYRIHHLGSLGAAEDIRAAYRAADVFALPSLEDNLPNTVMESLSVGTPVVAFRIGGLPEMLSEAGSGYLAEAGSASGFAEGIRQLLSSSVEFNQAAVNKVTGEYANQLVAERYVNLYRELL